MVRTTTFAASLALAVLLAPACGGDDSSGTGANGTGASGTGASGTGADGTGANGTGANGTGANGTGGDGTGATGAGGDGTGGVEACIGSSVLATLGEDHLLVGVSTSDAVAASAPFDVRYLYLAGAIADGAGPCASCASGCTAQGQSCSNAAGCGWWGCWQYDQDPPGAYVRNLVATASGDGQIPMITYYLVLQASGANEGEPEVDAINDAAFLGRYLADFRFMLQQIGSAKAIVHVEPDFWGYAEHKNPDPHATPAPAPAANATDCANEEASIAGLGRCMIAMSHKYAPNAVIGLHGSGWGTKMDVLQNEDPAFDVAGEAAKLGNFLHECGPAADLVVVDAADRDAEYYQSIGNDTWWDDTNAALPSFHQAFAWSKALSETMNKPHLWWQIPVGNMSLPGGNDHWKDNRVDYFFAHWDEVAAAHGVGAAFGAGMGGMTTPETDGGNLVAKTQAYSAAGGQKLCP